MAPYPETETMTLKRVEVAIKKRDWALLNDGISKIREKFDINHKWEHSTQWRDLLSQAEDARLPDDLWKTFCSIVSQILGSEMATAPSTAISYPVLQEEESQVNEQEVYETDQTEVSSEFSGEQKQFSFSEEKKEDIIISSSFSEPEPVLAQEQEELSFKEEVAVFYNEDVSESDAELISAYRNGLNALMEKESNYSPSKSWYDNLAYIVNSLNRPNSQMNEFFEAIKDIKVGGSIISSGYSSSVMQSMLKSSINFTMPAYRESDKSENYFKYIPLGGLINSYICPVCSNKSLKTGSHFEAVTGCCKKCASMIYPDIFDISSTNSVSSPKSWYQAFNSMVNSRVWVLVNPPLNSKQSVEEFLAYVASEAVALQRVYIISKNVDAASSWKHLIESKMPQVDVKDHYPSVSMFLNDFKELEIVAKAVAYA